MATTAAHPTTDLFSRLSFCRAVSSSPLCLPSSPPPAPRLYAAVVALHKRNPKRLNPQVQLPAPVLKEGEEEVDHVLAGLCEQHPLRLALQQQLQAQHRAAAASRSSTPPTFSPAPPRTCSSGSPPPLHAVLSPAASSLLGLPALSSSALANKVTYTVMDDLKVTPMSAISSITLLGSFGVRDLIALQEKTVQIGYKEGLAILKAPLQSRTVLTDVFLGGKKLPGA